MYVDGQGCQPESGLECANAASPRTVTQTDFNNDTIVSAYDIMGRLTSVSYSKDGNTEVYTYYNNGQVHTVTDQHGVTEYFYDVRDRLERETRPDGTQMDYTYDDVGNRTSVSITRGGIITSSTSYTYDELNRLETVTDSSGTTIYAYDAVGNLDTVTYPNGLVTDYDYNTINQLTDVFTRDAFGTLISHYRYDLTPTGRREVITELDGRTTAYCYDNLYRLTDEVIFDSPASPITEGCLTDTSGADYTATYDYDWVGNRTFETVDGVSTAYSYDMNDRLTQTGGTTFTYDNNGNTLTETLDGVVKSYSWDGKNKLISLEESGSNIASYTYNHRGMRTSKTEGVTTTNFIIDENRDYAQVLEEVVDGSAIVTYSYGHDLIHQERADAFSYYHYDGLGSTRSLSDDLGSFTDEYDYEAFGDVLNQTGSTENNYMFTGEQFDQSLEQYYLRARYYDQGIGRFTQMDTWPGRSFDPVTLHKYLYAHADPGNLVDPSGHFVSTGQALTALSTTASLVTAFSTGFTIGQFATGQRELSFRELGLAVVWTYVGSKMGVLTRPFQKLLRQSGCLNNSFVEGTSVATNNGLVNIQNINIGDLVYTLNETTGEHELKEVIHLISSEEQKEIIEIHFSNGNSIEVTPEHLLFNGENWVAAKETRSGQVLYSLESQVKIIKISHKSKKIKVYNFTVRDNHNYFVGENRVLAHNVTPCESAAKAIGSNIKKQFPKLCEFGKCKDFARKMEELMIQNGVKGRRICLNGRRGRIHSVRHGTVADTQNTGGGAPHAAVRVGDLVFDNFYPEGIPFDEWADDLGIFIQDDRGRHFDIWDENVGSSGGCL